MPDGRCCKWRATGTTWRRSLVSRWEAEGPRGVGDLVGGAAGKRLAQWGLRLGGCGTNGEEMYGAAAV